MDTCIKNSLFYNYTLYGINRVLFIEVKLLLKSLKVDVAHNLDLITQLFGFLFMRVFESCRRAVIRELYESL